MKRILKYLLFLGLGVLFVWTMYFLYEKSASKPDVFAVEHAKKNNVVKKTVANGKIVPRKEILIKPVVSGIIRELMVVAGQQVKKGDALARIQIVPDMLSLSSAENRVRSAEINVQNAQLNFDRNKPLLDKGVISAAEMQNYDIALRNAKQELDAAQEALQVVRDGISRTSAGNTVVRSTIDGMILDVPVKEGNSVIERNNFNEGTTIASIADMNDLIFQGNVDESEVGKVKLGMPVVLTVVKSGRRVAADAGRHLDAIGEKVLLEPMLAGDVQRVIVHGGDLHEERNGKLLLPWAQIADFPWT